MVKVQMQQAPTSEEFAPIPAGEILEAEVESVTLREMPFKDDDGNPVQRFEFKFNIIEGEWAGRWVYGSTSLIFNDNPNCKLRAWSQEIMNVDSFPAGYQLETDDLVGKVCRIHVGQRKGNNDRIYSTVSDVIRSKQRAPEAADIF